MQGLDLAGKLAFRKFVDRKIIGPRRQVNIVGIRLPFDPHAKDGAVKVYRLSNIPDAQRDMPET
jgi:hypothetical protein